MHTGPGDPAFPRTSWSLIAACQDPSEAAESLDRLFARYWRPVYLYVYRNWTREAEAAKDLTQAFFLSLLERDALADVAADRGRFRSYVLACLRHFLMNEKRRARAQRRRPEGGLLSLERMTDDGSRFDVPDARRSEPADQFVLDWKTEVLSNVIGALRVEGEARGKRRFVDVLVRLELSDVEPRPTYAELARAEGISMHQLNNGLHWARKQFKRLFRAELAEQTLTAEDLEAEARELFGIAL